MSDQAAAPRTRAEITAYRRQRLIEVALQLFAEQGYDETSFDEIAAGAGLSPRTFFRYFPTKESVLFFGEYDFIRSFEDVLMAQPPEVSDLDAIRDSLIVLAPVIERIRNRVSLYEQAVASSITLRGRSHANDQEHISHMAAAIARRRGRDQPDAGCRLVATISHAVLRQSIGDWLDGPPSQSTAEALADGFALLRAEVAFH
jgi:AcrR family transcriptional regulator